MANYDPYRTDSFGSPLSNLTGSVSACPHCGVKPRNQHSLRESGACDWAKKSPIEKARLAALNAAKEAA